MKMVPINPHEKKLHEILRVGGREFPIYIECDELGDETPNYPDFTMDSPVYTEEGWPFARSISSACQYWKPFSSESSYISSCGVCRWLSLESNNDLIGICMCESRKQTNVAREQNENVCASNE